MASQAFSRTADALAASAAELLEGRDTAAIDQLERLGGSSGGADPKILVGIDAKGQIVPATPIFPPASRTGSSNSEVQPTTSKMPARSKPPTRIWPAQPACR